MVTEGACGGGVGKARLEHSNAIAVFSRVGSEARNACNAGRHHRPWAHG